MTEARDSQRAEVVAKFDERYGNVSADPMVRAELRVTGCDYGATSYTTRRQADIISAELQLGPGRHLLDIGSGAGWPGIYLGASTGSSVTLADLTLEGLGVARRRVRTDGLEKRIAIVAAVADRLPFRDGTFDAATASDVFC